MMVDFKVEDSQSVMQATKDIKGVIKRMSEVIKERYRPAPAVQKQPEGVVRQEDLDQMKQVWL